MTIKIELADETEIHCTEIEMQGDWVIGHVDGKTVRDPNYRAIPREQIRQIIMSDSEERGRISWE